LEIRTVGGDRLRVEFKRNGTEVSFRVLQQDEALRGQGVLIKRNGKAIKSVQHPAIGLKSLFVRGRDIGEDNYIDMVRYDSEEEAKEEIEIFCALVEELNRDREEKIVGDSKLKVQFIRDGARVTMKVLEQDETLRSMNGGKEVLKKDGYAVYSWAFPAIDPNIIYIRGSNRDKDEISDTFLHLSPEAAKAAIDAFSKLIEEINNMDHRIVGGPRLQVEFWREGNKLTVQVLEQAEELRGKDLLADDGKYYVRSRCCPALDWYTLYVRGRDGGYTDWWKTSLFFTTSEEAATSLAHFTKLIEQINTTQTKTLEIGPYVVKATLIGDKLEISHERREVA